MQKGPCVFARPLFASISPRFFRLLLLARSVTRIPSIGLAGKTTLISTATSDLPGVVRVNVAPGAPQKEIVGDAFTAITRYNVSFLNIYTGSMRVIRWHKLFFGTPPTVVLRIRERSQGEKPASVGAAVRQLVEDYGAHVIVDSSDSSLEHMALKTIRQRVVQVGS